ncbi:MAG: GNAT family N-acetyltransferase [bacterium]
MMQEREQLRELLRQLEIMEAKTNARFVRDLASLHGTVPIVEPVGDTAWILHDNGPGGPFRGLLGDANLEKLGVEVTSRMLKRLFELDGAQILINPDVNGSLAAYAFAEGWTVGEIHLAYLYDLHENPPLPSLPEGVEIVREVDVDEGEMLAAAARCHLGLEQAARAEDLRIGQAFAMNPEIHTFVALVEGKIAGAAAVHGEGEIASLRGACTAPSFRRQGVQQALILARLGWALDNGYRYAFIGSPLGGATSRNAERLDFMFAGTRIFLEKRREQNGVQP